MRHGKQVQAISVVAACGTNRKGLLGSGSGDAVRLGIPALLGKRPPRSILRKDFMYVSIYDGVIDEAFRKGIDGLSETQEATIKVVIDELLERVSEGLRNSMKDWLIENLKDDIARKAAETAERMIESALAGDEDQIINLFGFYSHYKDRPVYGGKHPRQWDLLNAIIAKNPEPFVNEKIQQQASYIKQFEADFARHKQYCEDNHINKDGY